MSRIKYRMALWCGLWMLLAGWSLPAGAVPATRPATEPALAVYEFRGTGAEIGQQYAQQLHDPIHAMWDHFLLPAMPVPALRAEMLLAASLFNQYLPPEYQQEADALAHNVGLSYSQVLLAQSFLDLMPMEACSTISLPATASPDGVARFGRNLDFPSLGVLDKASVVLVFHPKDRYAFAAIGWPGMLGVLSGMNEHGLCLANMEVIRGPGLPHAMPYMLLYRSVLEQCKTVDEAIDLLKKTPHQTTNNLMIMDADGNRAVVEIKADGLAVRRGNDKAALISTNHQRGQDAGTPGRCWRYDRLLDESTRQFGKLDRPALEDMLKTVVQGHDGSLTVQSMVFEPSNRVIYLALGSDAPAHPYAKLDLRPYFEKPLER